MTTRYLVVAIVLLAALVESLQVKLKPKVTNQRLKTMAAAFSPSALRNKIAPPFEIPELNGASFNLADEVGKKVIVLNFFATWCQPCRQEMPELDRYYQAHRNEPFLLLAVDCGDAPADVQKYVQDLRLTFPTAVDRGLAQKLYHVTAFPTTVVIGVDGRIQFYITGEIPNANVAFDQFLRINQRLLRSNVAITKDAYLKEANPRPPAPASVALLGRPASIAARMPCPCGCDKLVKACTCHTARSIKKELASLNFGSKTDAQIMTELNRKFCMAGM